VTEISRRGAGGSPAPRRKRPLSQIEAYRSCPLCDRTAPLTRNGVISFHKGVAKFPHCPATNRTPDEARQMRAAADAKGGRES